MLSSKIHVFTLIAGISRAFLITDRLKNNDTSLIEKTVEILNTCYGNRVNEIGLSGEAVGTLSKLLASQRHFSATIFDNNKKIVTKTPAHRGYRYKVHVFVIAVSSSSRLDEYLRGAKNSVWWNHMATLFIIDYPSAAKPNCSKAHEMLWIAWQMNLIDAKFICVNGTDESLIYGYNPYTSEAPNPWRLEGSYSGKNGHPWSLYARNYRDDSRICKELDFEKTRDVGGYTILANEKDWYDDWSANGILVHANCTKGFDCFIVRILSYSLNATFKINLYDRTANLGFVDENGRVDGMLEQIIRGDCDIGLNNRYQSTMVGLSVTYPHWQSGLSVLTQYNDYRSQLGKIMSIIDHRSRIGVFIVYFFVNPFFFVFITRQAAIPAILNSVRVICYSYLPKLPRNSASRIYLVCLFTFMVTIQALHQGKLASLLTRSLRYPQVNTMSDLLKSEHKIYGLKDFGRFFSNSVFRTRFVAVKNEFCFENVLRDSSIACLDDVNRASYAALKYQLHRSRKTIVKLYWIWVIREDWPLERRINAVVARLLESGIIHRSYLQKTRNVYHAFEILEEKSNDESAKVLTLSQLRFAFAILGTGLAVAGTIFVIEIAIKIVASRKIRRGRFIVVGRM